ncbi:hypothetical protein [Flavobacterium sp. ACAM 123]|jgi:hypothetical protein|uniref:hypothetical protein n=1 Tax=Flavobacterium sp. ACAM 123 TaxID=1189620 RepID=UPI0003129843|nr:hypothetical protein [Flavobacterium sp. ACAM 123]
MIALLGNTRTISSNLNFFKNLTTMATAIFASSFFASASPLFDPVLENENTPEQIMKF